MPVPVGFQLGLELTNIVNPISQVVSALGSLALVDAIRKAGSDSITETKLASLLGRHRIDDVIKFHFREIVSKADQSLISRYMDIVLESGAGPTVQQALKDPALFSMVVQLSGLAFAHEQQSFALAIVEAIDRIVRDSGGDIAVVPDYVALLGTIRACQEQTAAFQWAALYEAVELKIWCALKSKPSDISTEAIVVTDEGGEDLYRTILPNSVTTRRLPFAVLQSLLMWLQSLQSFPEHRLLHLRCDSGISTAIVWCHHMLGLTVSIRLKKYDIRFGDGESRVIIEESDGENAGASLMDPVDQHEPLFSLLEDDSSPSIAYEHRTRAFGYGLKTLQQARLSDEQIRDCSHWVIARSVGMSRALLALNQDDTYATNVAGASAHFELTYLSDDQIVRAGKFLFALECDDWRYTMRKRKRLRVPSKICWPNLVALVFTFARIEGDDLDRCKTMPLCLSSFREFGDIDDPGQESDGTIPTKGFEKFDLLASFSVLTRLLLGKAYSDDYIKNAVLISAWGWSIYFDSVAADDPIDVSVNSMRVVCGLPSRSGLRKARIIDGPTERLYTKEDDLISICPGMARAKRDRVLVGQTSDAFQIMQMFKWSDGILAKNSNRVISNVVKMGFREMQDLCIDAKRFPPCICEEPSPMLKSKFDMMGGLEMILDGPNKFPGWIHKHSCDESQRASGDIMSTIRWPDAQKAQSLSQERVLKCKVLLPGSLRQSWLWDVSDNPAARWVQSWYLISPDHDERSCLAIRSRETCWQCAYDWALDFAILSNQELRMRVLL